ncbi:MAG: M23 family metallopeptidase [Hydrococcus sp. RM1_1_31]|nr:M23 family metallopeptidase [Hydrococcus sp. RM1_1_31]
MSYRSDVREIIKAKSGGGAFLAKVDSGAAISGAEMSRYFTPQDQDRIFKTDQTRNINQAIKEGFSGTRLIERTGQIHFGGPAAPIDGGSSDAHGRLTLYTYGKKLAQNYQKALSKSGQTCSTSSPSGTIANGDGKVTGKFINPVGGNGVRYPITSGFGPRNIGCNRSKYHPAVDLGTPIGTSVKAADGGVVTFAGNVSGYGYTVVVDHGNGVKTRYSHLDSYAVSQGKKVSQGQVIAKSGNSDGNTGVSTGEHLDFGIYVNDSTGMGQLPIKGNAVDPRKYINF